MISQLNLFSQAKYIGQISCPYGYKRIGIEKASFAYFLRFFRLSKDNSVYLFNGKLANNQYIHYAVLDIDIGKKDLQQCADAIIRLRAEYFFQIGQYSKIHFNFLADHKAHYYTSYAKKDRSYKTFRRYMNYVFAYANTSSLYEETEKIEIEEMKIGDIFIQKGNPYGHAVIVVDMAKNIQTGEKIFLLAQSFMPAQSIHILKNYTDKKLNPWYSTNFGEYLYTPEWTFSKDDLRRFRDK